MKAQTCADFNRAMEKIRDEMAANSEDAALCALGDLTTELLRRTPGMAEKIAMDGKTLKGAMEAIQTEARKHKKGNWACVDALQGMEIALKYYGFAMDRQEISAAAMAVLCAAEPGDKGLNAQQTTEADFDLDRLLEEI